MLIDFVHPGDAYLPELRAYETFLRERGHGFRLHRSEGAVPRDASVVWWMCGLVPHDARQRFAAALHVHEYASASVPPWAWAKDRFKSLRQPRPDYRLFQNEWVRRRMGFSDAVPFELRDMGIPPSFLHRPADGRAADHDFVYLGEMRRLRNFLHVFEAIGKLGLRVLLVGEVPPDLARTLERLAPVTQAGKVAYAQVPSCLRRARVGLNLVPPHAPFAHQTSTKLLEYCAVGLQVLSTDYPWVRAFGQRYGCRLNYLPAGRESVVLQAALSSALQTEPAPPSGAMDAVTWPRVLSQLRLWDLLDARG